MLQLELTTRLNPLIDRARAQPILASVLLSGGTATLLWAIQDYRAFLALGRGGVPYNIFGWLLSKLLLGPFSLSSRDTKWTGDFPDTGASPAIRDLPRRRGPRAEVGGLVPQRQLSQHASEEMLKVGSPRRSRSQDQTGIGTLLTRPHSPLTISSPT